MSKQFKPGDLALIVGANHLTQNIGKACELVQIVEMGDVFVAPDGESYWHGDSTGWLVTGDGLYHRFAGTDGEIKVGRRSWAVCGPQHLRPLRADFQPESEKAAEVTL